MAGLRLAVLVGVAGAGAATLVVAFAPAGAGPPQGVAAEAGATLTPRAHLFGDRVTAELVLPSAEVDADTVSVRARFTPYRVVRRERRQAEEGLVYTFELRCLSRACVPSAPQRQLRFPPADVRSSAGRLRVEWPPLLVASRVSAQERARPAFRADLESAPAGPSDGGSRGLAASFGGGTALLLAFAAWLLAGRRHAGAPQAAPEQPALPQPDPSPLARAVAVVELALEGDEAQRRTGLDALAVALGPGGGADLARAARVLAWSPAPPEPQAMRELLAAVRSLPARAA
jgi:hypothetical protein